jgi:hypothetical protein
MIREESPSQPKRAAMRIYSPLSHFSSLHFRGIYSVVIKHKFFRRKFYPAILANSKEYQTQTFELTTTMYALFDF